MTEILASSSLIAAGPLVCGIVAFILALKNISNSPNPKTVAISAAIGLAVAVLVGFVLKPRQERNNSWNQNPMDNTLGGGEGGINYRGE